MYVNKHRGFYCSKSKTIHGGTPVQEKKKQKKKNNST
jgi:hypothetical protein